MSQLTTTQLRYVGKVVYSGTLPQWEDDRYTNEIGWFIQDGYFDSRLSLGVGRYGLFNSLWPTYWLYGLRLALGYTSTQEKALGNRSWVSLLQDGEKVTHATAPTGEVEWSINTYRDTQGEQVAGPHPILEGRNGTYPNQYPEPGVRWRKGHWFDARYQVPHTSIAWGRILDYYSLVTRYDDRGLVYGESGYNEDKAGFENGGYTTRYERIRLMDAYEGGVWPDGPTGNACTQPCDRALGWGPVYEYEILLYNDPANISGLFSGLNIYGKPYVWSEVADGDLITYWYPAPITQDVTDLCGRPMMSRLLFTEYEPMYTHLWTMIRDFNTGWPRCSPQGGGGPYRFPVIYYLRNTTPKEHYLDDIHEELDYKHYQWEPHEIRGYVSLEPPIYELNRFGLDVKVNMLLYLSLPMLEEAGLVYQDLVQQYIGDKAIPLSSTQVDGGPIRYLCGPGDRLWYNGLLYVVKSAYPWQYFGNTNIFWYLVLACDLHRPSIVDLEDEMIRSPGGR